MTDLLRCPECRYQGPNVQWLNNQKHCPRCASGLMPFDPDRDLLIIGYGATDLAVEGPWIRLGWEELRVLTQWSRFWADFRQSDEDGTDKRWMLRVIDGITYNLRKAGGGAALTTADDMELIRRSHPHAKMMRPDGSEILMEPSWLNTPAVPQAPLCQICRSRHEVNAAHSTIGET